MWRHEPASNDDDTLAEVARGGPAWEDDGAEDNSTAALIARWVAIGLSGLLWYGLVLTFEYLIGLVE